MEITAKVIADSLAPNGSRITTFSLSYPRFVHSELMTHRFFSRNASSSRAIPIATMVDRALNKTAMPVFWGLNQKGMQASQEASPDAQFMAKAIWKEAAQSAVNYAMKLQELGIHKQIANRLIENFQNIETVVTSAQWANWYALRNHPDAQPEIKALTAKMLEAHRASVPEMLTYGDWHLPYVGPAERIAYKTDVTLKVSAARCARVSYLKHDGTKATVDEELDLYSRLVDRTPKHASPVEHQAQPAPDPSTNVLGGNLGPNWIQFRKTIPDECVTEYEEFR